MRITYVKLEWGKRENLKGYNKVRQRVREKLTQSLVPHLRFYNAYTESLKGGWRGEVHAFLRQSAFKST